MLYLTTRDKFDAYTKAHPLKGSRANNGGYYIPFKMPEFQSGQLLELKDKSVSQTVAEVLNLFFKTELCSWDVEFAIGRYPLHIQNLKQRIAVAELWRNTDGAYEKLEKAMANALQADDGNGNVPDWVRITVRIAVLLACYGEMLRQNTLQPDQSFDVATATGDMTAAMAAWYARQMGLPVNNIICGCNENSSVWNLLHLGEFSADIAVVSTTTPLTDVSVPETLERLVCGTLGVDETLRYCDIVAAGGYYAPPAGMLETLRSGLYGAVVSKSRLNDLIPSVYRTVGYVFGPYAALAYGALQDYRAKTGQTAPALILSDRSAMCDSRMVASAMNITETELTKLLREV